MARSEQAFNAQFANLERIILAHLVGERSDAIVTSVDGQLDVRIEFGKLIDQLDVASSMVPVMVRGQDRCQVDAELLDGTQDGFRIHWVYDGGLFRFVVDEL